MVEILKQRQYSPMPVENQVVIIYAATKGYLDEIPIPEVQRYQVDFLQEIENMHGDILKTIRETKDLSQETSISLTLY